MKFAVVFLTLAVLLPWTQAEISAINRKALRTLEQSMGEDGKPCSDYYQYACGKWATEHAANNEKYTSTYTKVNYEINSELVEYMDNTRLTNKPKFVQAAHAFYTSCTDIQNYSAVPYLQWLEEHEDMTSAVLASMAGDGDDDERLFDWVQTLAVLRKYGLNTIFINENWGRDEAKDVWLAFLDKPKLNDEFVALTEDQVQYVDRVAKLSTDNTTVEDLWTKISEFEELLVQLDEEEDAVGEEVITLEKLPLEWLNEYLNIIFNKTAPLDADMKLSIRNVPYMEALDALLQEYDAEFICRYLEIRFLLQTTYIPPKISDIECMQSTRGFLPHAMHWIYEQQHPEAVAEAANIQQIFNQIVEHINKTLRSDKTDTDWQYNLDKLRDMQLKVGNLPQTDTVPILESHYADLRLTSSDFYGNHLQLLQFYFNIMHSDRSAADGLSNTTANEYFNPTEGYNIGNSISSVYYAGRNIIVLPLTLLRQPFYHWGYDDIFKYSLLGTILTGDVMTYLKWDAIEESEVAKFVIVGSLHSAYETFFSLPQLDLQMTYPVNGVDLNLKELFFANAIHYYCNQDGYYNHVNDLVTHLLEFTETYDCKLNKFLEVFAHLSSTAE